MYLRSKEGRSAPPWKPPDVTTIAVRHEAFEHCKNVPVRHQTPEKRLQGPTALTRTLRSAHA